MKIRIISDLHGNYLRYIELVNDPNIFGSIQLGDFGLKYLEFLSEIDYKKNLVILGNHDRWDLKDKYPHFISKPEFYNLGDFNFFAIPGAYSIDSAYRTPGVDWFKEEEMTYQEGLECIELFKSVKPQTVLSHDCPEEAFIRVCSNYISSVQSITRQIMSNCFYHHKPKNWIFGHHHTSKKFSIEDCWFTCLDQLEYIDLEI